MLASRLAKVLPCIIHEEQCAFIQGRHIGDNILIAHELVKGYNQQHISPRCVIKVDLRKAYDSVEWPFIEQVLSGLHFPYKFTQWVVMCMKSVNFSLKFNGELLAPIEAKRGLRQGDPLSPLLFVIAMEYLARCIDELKNVSSFKYHPKCKKFHVAHCMFADDLLLFCHGDKYSVNKLMHCFAKFSAASGLVANMEKSELYCGGLTDGLQQELTAECGLTCGKLPVKYLGVPLSSQRLTRQQCELLVNMITSRITSWTSKLLSYGGRLQLIRSVLFGMQVYWTHLFQLPKQIIKEVEGICRSFLWTGSANPSRRALVAWKEVCKPRKKGGLGIFDLNTWNIAALGKLLWAIALKEDKLWVRWIHQYYIKQGDIWTAPAPSSASWMIRRIFGIRAELKSFICSCPNYRITRAYTAIQDRQEEPGFALRGDSDNGLHLQSDAPGLVTTGTPVTMPGDTDQFAHGQEELRPINSRPNNRNALESVIKQPYFSPQSSNNSPISPFTVKNVRIAPSLKEQATSKLYKASQSPSHSMVSVVADPEAPSTDWSPLDDAIPATLPSSPGKPPSREAVDLYIHNVLYGPSQRKRLPVFVDICSECNRLAHWSLQSKV